MKLPAKQLDYAYDAVVDAAGGGDYTSIASAFAAGNTTVYVRKGIYTETANIVMGDKHALVGESAGDCIINFNNASFQVIADASSGTKYSTGTISVTNSSTTVTGSGTLWLANISAGDFIRLDSVFQKVASVTNDTTLVLENPYEGDTASGLSYVAQAMYSGNCIKNITIANSNIQGIFWRAVRHSYMENVLVTSCGGTTTHNIDMQDCGSNRAIGIGSEFSDFGEGLNINNCYATVIANSDFNNNSSEGIAVLGNSFGIIIDGCFILNNDNNGVDINGTASRINLTSCSILRNNLKGVNSEPGTGPVVVDGCTIRNNGDVGVDFDGSSNIITDNIINNNGGSGMFAGDGGVITGNQVRSNGGDGIDLAEDSRCTVQGNQVRLNSGNGIVTQGTSNRNIIVGNQVRDNTATGILISTGNTNNIVTNNVSVGNTTAQITNNGTGTVTANNVTT